jgi:hypothetical protein
LYFRTRDFVVDILVCAADGGLRSLDQHLALVWIGKGLADHFNLTGLGKANGLDVHRVILSSLFEESWFAQRSS